MVEDIICQYAVLMDYDHVTEIPINQNGNDCSNWEVYDIPPILSGFNDNLSHDNKMSLYYE